MFPQITLVTNSIVLALLLDKNRVPDPNKLVLVVLLEIYLNKACRYLTSMFLLLISHLWIFSAKSLHQTFHLKISQ